MSETVIQVERAGKCYPFQPQYKPRLSLRETFVNNLWQAISNRRHVVTRQTDLHEPVWALRNISFEVKQGDNLALIGRNGAGKTTLLKLLANITTPSEGWIGSRGRVGSLFRLGAGFHPQMSGRENIYLNGVALGMSIAEVRRKFDAIVAFSELEQSIDMPVKFYSSGMSTRLGFSIFAHLEPEILLIDEALSAGDTGFQRKAAAKLAEISSSGLTTIFVSHNLNTIRQLCTTGLLLQRGRFVAYGAIDDVIEQYEATLLDEQQSDLVQGQDALGDAPSVQVQILNRQAQPKADLFPGDFVRVRLTCTTPLPVSQMTVTLTIQTRQRTLLLHLERLVEADDGINFALGHTLDCVIPQLPLGPDTYVLGVSLKQHDQLFYKRGNLALLEIKCHPVDGQGVQSAQHGLVAVEHCWEEIVEGVK